MENPRFHASYLGRRRRLTRSPAGDAPVHHKTRKKKFTIGVPLMLLVQIALFFFLVKADFSISI